MEGNNLWVHQLSLHPSTFCWGSGLFLSTHIKVSVSTQGISTPGLQSLSYLVTTRKHIKIRGQLKEEIYDRREERKTSESKTTNIFLQCLVIHRPWNATYPNRCSEDYSRLPLWIILLGKSPIVADKPRLWKSPAHCTTVIFCLGTKPQLCTLLPYVGAGRPIFHEQQLDRRQRLFLATPIRKEVQAEKDREELDVPQLAFPLPGAGESSVEGTANGRITWIRHSSSPCSQPFCSPYQAKGTQGPHCVLLWRMALSSIVLAGLFPHPSHWAGWKEQPSRTVWPGVTESLLGDLEAVATMVLHRQ